MVPPLAVSVALYGAVCVPFGKDVVVTVGGRGAALINVATSPDQLALPLNEKAAAYVPVDVTSISSFPAGEVPVSLSSMVNPLPADCVPL